MSPYVDNISGQLALCVQEQAAVAMGNGGRGGWWGAFPHHPCALVVTWWWACCSTCGTLLVCCVLSGAVCASVCPWHRTHPLLHRPPQTTSWLKVSPDIRGPGCLTGGWPA
jgi:hypothetical protein